VQKGDVVRMGDDNPCDVVGIGSVQIKTDDGMTHAEKHQVYTRDVQESYLIEHA
jgi:hypothetical protein